MKATRWMTVLMLAGGLAAGPVFGETAEDFEGAYGIMDVQVGSVDHAEGLPEENREAAERELTVGPEEEVQDSEEPQEEQLASASQYEPLG